MRPTDASRGSPGSTLVTLLVTLACASILLACGASDDTEARTAGDVASEGPIVLSMSPPDGRTRVPLDTEIVVTFDRPVDPATFNGDFQPNTTDFTVEWREDDTVLAVVLADELQADTTYLVAIDLVHDRDGNVLAEPVRSCFSTGDELDCPDFECEPVDATDGVVPAWQEVDYERPFDEASPFNRPIAPDALEASGSEAQIERFAQTWESFGGAWLGVQQNVVPVYLAYSDTPRHDVPLSAPNDGRTAVLEEVPIPTGALADCGYDRFLVTVDVDAGLVYELHRAVWDGREWRADTGAVLELGSSGIHAGDGDRSSTGVRASGSSLLAGLVWPHEIESGRIEHALAFGYDFIRDGGPVDPFTASDGQIDDESALPMGSHLQLDPSLDLDELDLEPWERTVAVALQEYGMYLVDTAGGISIQLVHGQSFEGDPWETLLPPGTAEEGGVLLSKLPPDAFRVLEPWP